MKVKRELAAAKAHITTLGRVVDLLTYTVNGVRYIRGAFLLRHLTPLPRWSGHDLRWSPASAGRDSHAEREKRAEERVTICD